MSCPDRLALFIGLEEQAPAIRAHLESCAACRSLAAQESALDDALGRLRDPSPPGDLLSAVLGRVDEAALLARRARRQTAGILAGLFAALVAGLAAIGPDGLVGSLLDAAGTLSALKVAAGALARSLAPVASPLAVPFFIAQAVALFATALALYRLVSDRVRTTA